jgi:putative membrane protein
MILFWGVLIGAVATRDPRPSRPRRKPPRAEQVLAERFARGEIDADEYRQRLDILR